MRRSKAVDWSLYLVTDPNLSQSRLLPQTVEAAVKGGAGIVQYRDKQAGTRKMVETAAALCDICHRLGVFFLVNDRVDVALAVGADGVHVGQEDMPAVIARRLLGKDKMVGVTVHNAAEIAQAEREGADYLSLAPVFATSTKPDHQTPLGPHGIKMLAAEVHLPVVAIGGINQSNAAEVIRSGVQGVCVVSAVLSADDPFSAAQTLCHVIQAAKAERR